MKILVAITLGTLSFSSNAECTSKFQEEIKSRKVMSYVQKSGAISSVGTGLATINESIAFSAGTSSPLPMTGTMAALPLAASATEAWKSYDEFKDVLSLINQADLAEGEVFETFYKGFNTQFKNFSFSKVEIADLILRENEAESLCRNDKGKLKFKNNLYEVNHHLLRFIKITTEVRQVDNEVYHIKKYEIVDEPIR